MLGLSKPVADCAVCFEIYFDECKSALGKTALSLCCFFSYAAAVVTGCGPHAAVAHAAAHAGEDATQQLDALRLRCMQLLQPHVEAYIWQHEPLNLQSSVQQQPPWTLRHRGEAGSSSCNPLCGSIQLGGLSTNRL